MRAPRDEDGIPLKDGDYITFTFGIPPTCVTARVSNIGGKWGVECVHPASASSMLRAIPAEAVNALPARLIAQMIDANWRLASASKAIAARDALTEGGVWDEARGAMREFAQ